MLLDQDGHVKIADFGLAKLLSLGSEDHTLTRAEQVMGTLQYMAPEQMEGAKRVDHRADIYSLGVVFYEMLTGNLPVGRFESPSERVSVDVRVDEIVLRALERDPERRYQHVREVKTDVDTVCEERAAVESPPPARKDSARGDAPGHVQAVFMGLCTSFCAWVLIKYMFVFGIGGLGFSGWGVGASAILLAAVAWFTLRLRLRADPELGGTLASSRLVHRSLRLTCAAVLFGFGMLFLFSGVVEAWDRSTSTYVSSRPDHRLMTLWDDTEIDEALASLEERTSDGSAFRLHWGSHETHEGRRLARGFHVKHRMGLLNTLFVGLMCLSLFVLPLVATGAFQGSWLRCWRHVFAVPLSLFLGLALVVGIRWLTNLDDPAFEMKAVVRQWRVEAGIDAVREELEAFLAEESYDSHARLLGSVYAEDDRELLAFHDLLGSQPASRFDRWRLSPDRPVPKMPHLLLELTGDLDQEVCVVRLDAGLLREDLELEHRRWELWLKMLEQRLEALGT